MTEKDFDAQQSVVSTDSPLRLLEALLEHQREKGGGMTVRFDTPSSVVVSGDTSEKAEEGDSSLKKAA